MIKRVMMMMMIYNTFIRIKANFVKVNFCPLAVNVNIYEVLTLPGVFHIDSHQFIIIYSIHSQSP